MMKKKSEKYEFLTNVVSFRILCIQCMVIGYRGFKIARKSFQIL